MKKTMITLLAAAVMMVSCKDNDNDTEVAESYDTETENTMPSDTSEDTEMTREEAEEMSRQIQENVTVDENNNVNIQNFTAYGELQNAIRNLSVDPATRDEMLDKTAMKAFKHFKEEMPTYLKTTYVLKEVDDVEKAMMQYQKDLDNENVSKETVKNHLADLKEAVRDLNDEISDLRLSLDTTTEVNYATYRDFVDNVNYNDRGLIVITNFDAYNTLQDDWYTMSSAADEQKMTQVEKLNNDFQTMLATMPSYMKFDDVMNEIKDVQEEMNEYQMSKRNNADQDELMENVNEIDEALYDLNKEIRKARKRYAEDRRDATEEFMEEFTSDSDQTIRERVKDATEEYEEEMGS